MATTSIGAPGVVFPDGTTQASASPGNVVTRIYTSGSTGWTKPVDLKAIKVSICGGGGGKGYGTPTSAASGGGGGGGGYLFLQAPSIPGPLTVTVGGGGAGSGSSPAQGASGGTSSFGALASATGGTGGRSFPTILGSGGTMPTSFSQLGSQGQQGSVSTGAPSAFGFGNCNEDGVGYGYGYGGGGGSRPQVVPGGAGFVVVEEFY